MASIKDSVTAKFRKAGKEFEIFVDCDAAMAFGKGSGNIQDVLSEEIIYSDAKKFLRASNDDLKKAFGTEDVYSVAEEIVKQGHVNVTAEYLNKERDVKRRQIIDLIARDSIDPKTNKPHPPQRIESAMDEAKVKIDENKPAEAQIKEIVSKLSFIIPIKYGTIKMQLKVGSKYAAASYSTIKKLSTILSERWENDGSLVVNVEIPSGALEKFESSLNSLTHGEVETKKLE